MIGRQKRERRDRENEIKKTGKGGIELETVEGSGKKS